MSKNRIVLKSCLLLILLTILSSYSSISLANKAKASSTQTPQESALSSNKNVNKESTSKQSEASTQNVNPTPEGMVNINKADAEELARKLKGIGVRKAKAIIEYRETFGEFTSIENIQEVPGIGPVFIEMNRDKIIL